MSKEPATAEVVVDARGLRCPLPVIRLAAAARDRPDGTVLAVLATDPAAVHDVPAWCRMRGHTWLAAEQQPGDAGWRLVVRLGRPRVGADVQEGGQV